MKKTINITLMLAVVLSLTGCSFFAQKTQELTVNTNPKDCDVYINGKFYKAPVSIMIPRTSKYTVTATKEGYKAKSDTLYYSLSTVGALDVIGCWLILLPGLGLLSDGAWEIGNSHLYFELEKAQ